MRDLHIVCAAKCVLHVLWPILRSKMFKGQSVYNLFYYFPIRKKMNDLDSTDPVKPVGFHCQETHEGVVSDYPLLDYGYLL